MFRLSIYIRGTNMWLRRSFRYCSHRPTEMSAANILHLFAAAARGDLRRSGEVRATSMTGGATLGERASDCRGDKPPMPRGGADQRSLPAARGDVGRVGDGRSEHRIGRALRSSGLALGLMTVTQTDSDTGGTRCASVTLGPNPERSTAGCCISPP